MRLSAVFFMLRRSSLLVRILDGITGCDLKRIKTQVPLAIPKYHHRDEIIACPAGCTTGLVRK
jgi:hypothetical protein